MTAMAPCVVLGLCTDFPVLCGVRDCACTYVSAEDGGACLLFCTPYCCGKCLLQGDMTCFFC